MSGRKKIRHRRGLHFRRGMASLEVVMTTVLTLVILTFAAYSIMRVVRVIYSVIGTMTGSPLM